MNTTNTTSANSNNTNPIYLTLLFLSMLVTGFHCCSLYASVKSKELRSVRFLRLALFLSLSDCAVGIEFMYGILLTIFDNGEEVIRFQCMLIKDLTAGTVVSSLLHTLLICFERLNATFTSKQRILNYLTSNTSVGLCFAIPHSYALVRFGINVSIYGFVTCDPQYTIKPINLMTHDLIVVLLIASMAGVYGVVAKRMIKQQNTIGIYETNFTETQMERNKHSALRMRKNMATLGMIIIIAVISAFPRGIIGLYINVTDSYVTVEPYLQLSTTLVLLTPLLDPVIYLFRIKKYREHLVCKCCPRSNAIRDSKTVGTEVNQNLNI